MTEGTLDNSKPGVLHVLMDVGPDLSENDFHQWYNSEHGPARMAIKGFESGLRYEAKDGLKPTWLATYEMEGTSVVQTPAYLALRDNRTPRERHVMERISYINRSICQIVLCKGRFEPTVGTVLIMVRLLIPSVNAKELEDWYHKEHIDMLAEVRGWLRSRLLKEETSLEQELIQYMALHEYLGDNELGGPKHLAAMNTDWRTRIMSLSIGGPIRRDFQLIHVL